MTDQATRVVPAGWYEDPASAAHVRWWNGIAWTEHTHDKPAAPPVEVAFAPTEDSRDPDAAAHEAVTAARIAEARELERQFRISTADQGPHEDVYRPSWGNEGDADPVEARTATASAWFIALWPVLTLIALGAAGYVGFFVWPEPQIYGIPVVLAVALVPYFLSILWAVTDVRRLRRFGHRPASARFSLLGPFVYLVARRVRVRGIGPLVTLLVLTVLVAGGLVAAWYTDAVAPVLTAVEIQQTVSGDLVGSGVATSVTCPIFIESTAPGTLYTCDATLADGSAKTVWVSFDSVEGDFSYSLSAR